MLQPSQFTSLLISSNGSNFACPGAVKTEFTFNSILSDWIALYLYFGQIINLGDKSPKMIQILKYPNTSLFIWMIEDVIISNMLLNFEQKIKWRLIVSKEVMRTWGMFQDCHISWSSGECLPQLEKFRSFPANCIHITLKNWCSDSLSFKHLFMQIRKDKKIRQTSDKFVVFWRRLQQRNVGKAKAAFSSLGCY